jgi:putative transcription factor
VIIEGAKLTVCNECAKHGKTTWEEPAPKLKLQPQKQSTTGIIIQAPIQIRKRIMQAKVDTSEEITENYSEIIRQAREKLGFSTEDLGLKINERETVLRKIETGKLKPNNLLVSKLEHLLKIKLLVPVSEEKVTTNIPKIASHELTLGDLIKENKKSKGE